MGGVLALPAPAVSAHVSVPAEVPAAPSFVSPNQRPLEVKSLTSNEMYYQLQEIRTATEAKKCFVTAQVISINKLHRPPGSRSNMSGRKLPSLKEYEIRDIFDTYVTLHMDRHFAIT